MSEFQSLRQIAAKLTDADCPNLITQDVVEEMIKRADEFSRIRDRQLKQRKIVCSTCGLWCGNEEAAWCCLGPGARLEQINQLVALINSPRRMK